MLDCDKCGGAVMMLEPRDLLALVPSENRFEVRQLIRRYGGRRSCLAFVCPSCHRCGLTNDLEGTPYEFVR